MDYSDLRAVFINCTLKRSPEVSNTDGLASVSMETMRRRGVAVDASAPSTTRSPPASGPDMTEHGWEAMNILYSLQHLGYTIPPQADSGWIGEAGQRLHEPQHDVPDLEPPARGPDAQGRGRHPRPRQPALRVDAGCRFDFANPEHR